MPSGFKRTDRIAQLMQRKLAMIIQKEIKDPRLPALITISAAEVSKDLGHAKIYFTVFNGSPSEVENILNTAAPYLRSILAKDLTLRTVPQLHFIHDKSIEYGSRLSRLIDEVNPKEDENSENH
ncbi:MAG TPA: 30S ribosome-binding factor RbfA [Legionellaceae bacterium]|nr:30S ribosome-binding factor RbfA [Legionellaceae bacterium]